MNIDKLEACFKIDLRMYRNVPIYGRISSSRADKNIKYPDSRHLYNMFF